MNAYQTVIGLEVHVELLTDSKMFCSCSAEFGGEPNSHVCPVCLGLPGSLPVVNKKALELGLRTAIALNCQVSPLSIFVRKSYFYPDLPKNFQISQYRNPLGVQGWLEVDGRKIGITRVHMEEDTGKLLHELSEEFSFIDFNRSGVPLMEIVTEPDIHNPEEAEKFLMELHRLLRYIEVSDCNMEEGSLRCDANISVKKLSDTHLGTKVEVKNMNSFKSVRKALHYEETRLRGILESGGTVEQETRLWDDGREATEGMRTKEEAHDYRYFPEPDLPPVFIEPQAVDEARKMVGELPGVRQARFRNQFGLSPYDASVLTAEKALADYFERACEFCNKPKQISNWIQTNLLGILKEKGGSVSDCPVLPEHLASIVEFVESGRITATAGKIVLAEVFATGKNPERIISERNLIRIDDVSELERVVTEVIKENQQAVMDFRQGKERAIGFLVGMAMKKTGGKANPNIVKDLIINAIKNSR